MSFFTNNIIFKIASFLITFAAIYLIVRVMLESQSTDVKRTELYAPLGSFILTILAFLITSQFSKYHSTSRMKGTSIPIPLLIGIVALVFGLILSFYFFGNWLGKIGNPLSWFATIFLP